MKRGTKIALAAGAAGLVLIPLLASGSGSSATSSPPPDGHPVFVEPVMIGPPSDPKIGQALADMGAYFRSQGIDTTLITPRELTRLRKAPGAPSAIPPRSSWPFMAETLKIFEELRREVGPLVVTNGYRPQKYNEQVGGAQGSAHRKFSALDLMPPASAPAGTREKLALAAAKIWKQNRGKLLGMGLGVYGTDEHPSNIHIDVGRKARVSWANAAHWIKQV